MAYSVIPGLNVKLVLVPLFLGFCLMVLSHEVEGGSSHMKREEEEEEDFEFERQLKLLNKPAMKSIQSEYGDIFDCVDIYKQPAFDHPLLKNHKLQMMPSSFPKGLINKPSSTMTSMIGLMSEECPQGTIPIRRVHKEELKRTNLTPNFNGNSSSGVHPFDPPISLTKNSATVKLRKKYYGAKANLNVYGVANVATNRFSSSGICVTTGFDMPKDQINTVQAGWMVQPNLFGDNRTRFYSYWTANGYQGKGCYNLLCPGFVQINTKVPLGSSIKPLSTICETQYAITLLIFQDVGTKNWWLYFGGKPVGYWPHSLFGDLANHASQLLIGGLVGYPKGETPPAMGNGYYWHFQIPFPDKCKNPCYTSEIQFVNDAYELVTPENKQLIAYTDYYNCYKVSSADKGKFYFGGPDRCHWD